MRKKYIRPFFRQKPLLYFDENFPARAIEHFRSRYWNKRIRVSGAIAEGRAGRPDTSHYSYCQRRQYTLVTLDLGFNDDHLFPFTHGHMAGIIMIRSSPSEEEQIISILSRLLHFIISVHFPKGFLAESKFLAATDDIVMRGRDVATKEIKSLRIKGGVTTMRDVFEHFHY